MIGDCVKPYASGWIKTKADSRSNAGTVGVVKTILDTNTFEYIVGGLLPNPGAYVDGENYFLSLTNAGKLMTLPLVEIWNIGEIREFIGTGRPEGLMVEIDVGDEITGGNISYSTHNPVTVDPSSSAYASITAGQVLTITPAALGNHNPVTIATDSSSLATIGVDQVLHLNITSVPNIYSNDFEFCVTPGIAQTFVYDLYAAYGYTINKLIAESDGTLNGVSVKIGSTPITGISSISVSTVNTFNATALNVVAQSNRVVIETSTGYSGAPTIIRGKIVYTK